MRVEQITKAEHERRLLPWFQRAINDAAVHPFLSVDVFRNAPIVEDTDWGSAKYMDELDRGLLSCTFDHQRRSASIGIWVLGCDPVVAAALMSFALRVIPNRYGVDYLTFLISEANVAWRDRVMRSAGRWLWGVEPAAAYDARTGKMVGAYHFKVPVAWVKAKRRSRSNT